MLKRGLFLLLLCLSVAQTLPAKAATTSQRSEAFEPAECMFELPILTFVSPEIFGFECGYVIVPEQHHQPEGPTIRLAVAVLPSQSPNPESDPLFMAQGGPGGSSLEIFPFLMLGSPIRLERDIVIFDQRGTLYSEPNLLCPEIETLTEETIELDLSPEEANDLGRAAYQACGERLVEAGINLAAYNSIENAADIEAVRLALGYGRINFYGVSYGTLLGLHYMRTYPDSLRSAILDAVVPAQGSFLANALQTADRAFGEVVQLCQADSACSESYPDLEDVIYELVDHLNQNPITVPVVHPETGRRYQASVNGDLFINTLFITMYDPSLMQTLPALVYNTRQGNYDQLSALLPLIAFQPTFSLGMYQTVVCAEEANFEPEAGPVAGVRPELAELMRDDNEFLLEICDLWNIPKLGPEVNEPVVSSVPALLLSGRFDPITPPAFAETAAETLDNSYVFTFPDTSHGAFISSFCANQVVLDFLDDPTQAPGPLCLYNDATDFNIPTSGKVMMTQVVYNVINTLENGRWGTITLFLLSLLFLSSFFLIWPLAFLIRKMRQLPPRSKQPGSTFTWAAPGLAIVMAGLSLLFFGGLIILFLTTDFSLLLVGVPWVSTPLFLIPFLLLGAGLGMGLITALSWTKGYWSLGRRAYYSLLTLAALIFVSILGQWGMLTIFW